MNTDKGTTWVNITSNLTVNPLLAENNNGVLILFHLNVKPTERYNIELYTRDMLKQKVEYKKLYEECVMVIESNIQECTNGFYEQIHGINLDTQKNITKMLNKSEKLVTADSEYEKSEYEIDR